MLLACAHSPSFFPSSLSPTPFDACYAGYEVIDIVESQFDRPSFSHEMKVREV